MNDCIDLPQSGLLGLIVLVVDPAMQAEGGRYLSSAKGMRIDMDPAWLLQAVRVGVQFGERWDRQPPGAGGPQASRH